MAKNTLASFDGTTPGNNTDIANINIGEGWPPANVNNAIRQLMTILRHDLDPLSLDSFAQNIAGSPGDFKSSLQTIDHGNWLYADGRTIGSATSSAALKNDAYQTLYLLCGGNLTGWNAGTPIAIPDCRGRTAIGAGAATTYTSARAVLATGGEETHQLSSAEMPSHSHTLTDPGHLHYLVGQEWAYVGNPGGSNAIAIASPQTAPTPQVSIAGTGITLAYSGSSGSHNNMQPWIAANIFIRF